MRANDLLDVDRHTPVRAPRERNRLDARVDLAPLAGPVVPNLFLPCRRPPSQAFGQSTSSVIAASSASMSRALKAAYRDSSWRSYGTVNSPAGSRQGTELAPVHPHVGVVEIAVGLGPERHDVLAVVRARQALVVADHVPSASP